MGKTRLASPPSTNPSGPILLADLAPGGQLLVLVALIRAGGIPMSNRDLLEETGIRDDERLAEALRRLSRRNLVHRYDNPGNKNEWVATAVARQFFLPAGQSLLDDPEPAALPTPAHRLQPPTSPSDAHFDSDSGKTGIVGSFPNDDQLHPAIPEKPESLKSSAGNLSVDATDSGKTGITSPEKESVKLTIDSINSVLVSHLIQLTQTATQALPQELEAVYTEALLRGRVYRQLVPGLARALAAEGLKFLPHLLAHLAYSRSNQFALDGQKRPGAYVKLAVQERALGDPQFMPPAGLSFEAALAWALRGGHFETDMPASSDETAPSQPELDETLLVPIETKRGLMAPVAVWQAVLERLALECTKSVWETWFRPLAACSYDPKPETFIVGVPQVYIKDWVETRKMDRVTAALEEILGRPAQVKIEVKRPGN